MTAAVALLHTPLLLNVRVLLLHYFCWSRISQSQARGPITRRAPPSATDLPRAERKASGRAPENFRDYCVNAPSEGGVCCDIDDPSQAGPGILMESVSSLAGPPFLDRLTRPCFHDSNTLE